MTAILGVPRVVMARRVMTRFGAADGGLLAAGVAYNAVLAIVPLGLLGTGVAGMLLADPESRADMIRTIGRIVPPLAGVVDEIVGGLSRASPSVSIVGLVLAAWGASRLFAALESAIAQLDLGAPRRSLIRRTARRIGSVAVVAAIVVAAVVITPLLAFAVEMSDAAGSTRRLLDLALAVVPPVVAGIALAAIYRLVPVARPSWRSIRLPAVVGALALVAMTRVFVFLTPRVFGANLVYGTLGALLVALAWLDIVATVILVGSAWVRERSAEDVAPVA